MKSIDTLVKDIYDLFDPLVEVDLNEKEVDAHLDSFTESIKETLRNFLNEVPLKKRNLRLSAIGKPARQLWYDKNSKEEPKPLEPSTRVKFLYGHILEDLLILFSRLAGHTVTDLQKTVSVNGIKGHQDCVIDGVLVDCKSASGRSSLLVAFIVNISVLVGVMRMKVKGYVYSIMQMETGILRKLKKLLM
jgi:hypothetical protein